MLVGKNSGQKGSKSAVSGKNGRFFQHWRLVNPVTVKPGNIGPELWAKIRFPSKSWAKKNFFEVTYLFEVMFNFEFSKLD